MGSPILEAIAALATILSALGVGRYLRRWRKRIRGVYKSERSDDSFLGEHTQFFKPNDIKPAVPNDQDSIAYLAGLVMDDNEKKSKFYLLKRLWESERQLLLSTYFSPLQSILTVLNRDGS